MRLALVLNGVALRPAGAPWVSAFCCALLVLACAPPSQAQVRALLSPTAEAPLTLRPGGTLSMLVEVATGLTPPPGVQEERALRMFTLSLCADGVDLGGGARRCFALPVRNVRPLDATSLRYRVQAPLPTWVAPWIYDVRVRFPGGQVSEAGAVVVRAEQGARFNLQPLAVTKSAGVVEVEPSSAASSLVRVHVGASGLALHGAPFRAYPLPDPTQGFAPGFVALVAAQPSQALRMTKRQAAAPARLAIVHERAYAGQPITLRAQFEPRGAAIFWWLEPMRGAQGDEVTTLFFQRGAVPLEVLAVWPDGRFVHTRRSLPIWQRRSFGCAIWQMGTSRRGGVLLIIAALLLLLVRRRRERCPAA